MKYRYSIFASILVLFSLHPAFAEDNPNAKASYAGDQPDYVVQCPDGTASATQCQVDNITFIGWLTYSEECQVCHGNSGLGTTFGPNLMVRLKDRVDWGRFQYVIKNGYRGHVGAMPAWADNPVVMKTVRNLYAYLKARTDGVLPAGRPQKMKTQTGNTN
ncbi:MAG: hypothetical protein GY771_01535 [bacterium]|nr:hypothetical protein [bacterium]